MKRIDFLILSIDKALRVVTGITPEIRQNPARCLPDEPMLDEDRQHSAGLMRVNHVGEVCAQALYQSQAFFCRNAALKQQFIDAGREEEDHLAWTAERLKELGSHVSLLNPFWYAGAFLCGTVAAHMGDPASLGFVVETERQVEAHLDGHLALLPEEDVKSRAIVAQMRDDEVAHGAAAQALGAADVPLPVQKIMAGMGKVMSTVAYYV